MSLLLPETPYNTMAPVQSDAAKAEMVQNLENLYECETLKSPLGNFEGQIIQYDRIIL